MQEFSSISVSSYEAGSLADRLTEQSRDGWDVIAIVPTGSTVTAYLTREAKGEASSGDSIADTAGAVTTAPEASTPDVVVPVVSTPDTFTAAAAEPEPAVTPTRPDAYTPLFPEVSAPEPTVSEPVSSPVDEPAGWAIAPESASTPSTSSDPLAGYSSSGAGSSTGGASSDASTGAAAIAAAANEVAASAAVPEQPVASAAPAGWYADPSSRYELRYWDGTQWTEHVSRAGQQFTDPPVA